MELRNIRPGRTRDNYNLHCVSFSPLKALTGDDPRRKGMTHFHSEKDLLCDNGEDSSAQNGKTYQLYTLYRDKNGNIRQVTDFF